MLNLPCGINPETGDIIRENPNLDIKDVLCTYSNVSVQLKSLLDAMSSLPKPAMAVQVLLLHVMIRFLLNSIEHNNIFSTSIYIM